MATIKSYTDISQSKTLSKILPIESADMWWNFYSVTTDNTTPQIIHIDTPWVGSFNWNNKPDNIPCWSLAALLDVIPYTIYKSDNEFYRLGIDKGYDDYAIWYNNNGFTITDLDVISDNFVDACVAMIEKLHEQKLL